MSRQQILMCDPNNFDVDYVINPWMQPGAVDRELAIDQWCNLHDLIEQYADISVMESDPTVPDLIFTANAGFVIGDTFVVSKFTNKERQPESPIYRKWIRDNTDLDTVRIRYNNTTFEGAGDCLISRTETPIVFVGNGSRSNISASYLEALTQYQAEVHVLGLRDPRFYHLDTCFCPLDDGYLLWYPEAFSAWSREIITELFPREKRIAATEEDAVMFACNAVNIDKEVIFNNCTDDLKSRLEDVGFNVHRVDLSQFLYSGGGAKCLTLKLQENVL